MTANSPWLDYCLAKPGAWQDEPWEGDVVVKVADKIFAFLGSAEHPTALGLKCGNREAADVWLERYPGAAHDEDERFGRCSFQMGPARKLPDRHSMFLFPAPATTTRETMLW